ncbi:MAG TPA: FAD-linked oxidase C-terminal domain-containing protein [Burkholderiales bacterium]|nr:FAD-linked oxidase C-terminal domain-containing protein [Burkholderiales bacterium]
MDGAPAKMVTVSMHPRAGGSALAKRLAREIEGEVLFDAASRGRYATDASIYQVDPVGVVVPKNDRDAKVAMQIAVEEGIPILARGAGSSQCGQAVGAALLIDNSKYLNRVVSVDRERAVAVVEPGVVLDALNAQLRPHGLWFPVDVSTSAQATLGGMAGNNSCGSRSIRYGNMVHNVLGIDAVLADGSELHFGTVPADPSRLAGPPRIVDLAMKIRAIAEREAAEIAARWPKVLRRVQGYNLDTVAPEGEWNFAQLLVGSEGTLAYSKRIHLKLSPVPRFRSLGVCHFAAFRRAMEAPQHIVKLAPTAVELVDRTMIGLARSNPAYRGVVEKFIEGDPDAILLVEFVGEDRDGPAARLQELAELMGDLGNPDSVIQINDVVLQREVWEVRKAGLNIMMSMKGDGKPVSFIEDCAVPLEHLAEYTDALTRVFRKHGTEGTWYAHASVGTLHVRPVLNMKTDGAAKMRAIAEEACALVKRYKGAAYSGEHGDGLVRSEWIAPIIGERLAAALVEIKALFDPKGLMNPGKIVRPSKQDDRSLFRFKPGYAIPRIDTVLDWSEWSVPGAASTGLAAAVEMCNNNGHCRKFDAGTMCPSFRATGDEKHLTRGRANTLRLAISGQLGNLDANEAFTSDELFETLDLCVSCKGCKRECPTGVDMAKMKIEFLHHYHARHGYSIRDRLVAYLPRYAPLASRFAGITNLYQKIGKRALGFAAERSLPKWRRPFLNSLRTSDSTGKAGEVVLFVDTFSNYFEPENARAALAVLDRAGYGVHIARAADGGRPLCCGRTFLAAGMVEEAKAEARRMIAALKPHVERGVPVIGLEPSCLLGLRDEFKSMLPGTDAEALAAQALLLEEFLAREHDAGRLALQLKPIAEKRALLHGHCHQKAFGAMPAVRKALSLVPELKVETIESSCCGMAGSFGYEAAHYEVSMKMAELSLLPKVRAAGEDTLLVADGTSCRHQIADGAARESVHVAQVLARALA